MLKLAIVLGLGVAMVSGGAGAETRASVRMVRVAYGDLDLASPAGARTMLHRLTVAAKALCVNLHTPVLPGESGRADRCRRETIASAVERLHRPQLTLTLAEVPAEP